MYRAVSRNPNPTTVAANRRLFGRVAATVFGLRFRALHLAPFLWLGLGLGLEDVTAHITPVHHT